MLAYNYPLLDVFWSMLEIFFFIIWIYLLFIVFVDIFRSHDMGGFAKAIWVLFVIIIPYLGNNATFEKALTKFAESYADQNERDYERFAAACKSGRLHAEEGV